MSSGNQMMVSPLPPFSLSPHPISQLPASLHVLDSFSPKMEELYPHSRRPGRSTSRLHQPRLATPKEKEDFSLPELTSKISREGHQ